ncbi:MAG: hypothetical protein WAV54_07920 [Acidimicrobiales bacterium]
MHTAMCDDKKRRTELRLYMAHLRGIWPGAKVPVFAVHPGKTGDITTWETEDCQVLVDEGRRQLDAQRDQTEQIRGRAQFLFTTCLGLAAVSIAGRSTVFAGRSIVPLAIWSLGLFLTALGTLGAASVIVARKDFGSIDAAVLTTDYETPVLPKVAAGYSRQVSTGANTVATLVTVYRDAVLFVLLGATCWGIAWISATV